MDPRERIDRMLAEGRITASQAAQLRAGLGGSGGAPRLAATTRRRMMPPWLIPGLLGLLVLVGLMMWVGGAEPPAVQNVGEWMETQNDVGDGAAMLSRNLLLMLLVLIPVTLIIILLGWSYNGLVHKEEAVYSAWAQLESNYQRRQDLIPSLVDTVSRYMQHERETLEGVTEQRGGSGAELSDALNQLIEARAGAAAQMASADGRPPADEASLAAIAEAQALLSSQSRKLLAVVEDYPELRSADQFLSLQAQLEGTENRINVARMRFNEAVQRFNSGIRKLPGNLVASLGDFKRKAYFKADEGAEDASVPAFR